MVVEGKRRVDRNLKHVFASRSVRMLRYVRKTMCEHAENGWNLLKSRVVVVFRP